MESLCRHQGDNQRSDMLQAVEKYRHINWIDQPGVIPPERSIGRVESQNVETPCCYATVEAPIPSRTRLRNWSRRAPGLAGSEPVSNNGTTSPIS